MCQSLDVEYPICAHKKYQSWSWRQEKKTSYKIENCQKRTLYNCSHTLFTLGIGILTICSWDISFIASLLCGYTTYVCRWEIFVLQIANLHSICCRLNRKSTKIYREAAAIFKESLCDFQNNTTTWIFNEFLNNYGKMNFIIFNSLRAKLQDVI